MRVKSETPVQPEQRVPSVFAPKFHFRDFIPGEIADGTPITVDGYLGDAVYRFVHILGEGFYVGENKSGDAGWINDRTHEAWLALRQDQQLRVWLSQNPLTVVYAVLYDGKLYVLDLTQGGQWASQTLVERLPSNIRSMPLIGRFEYSLNINLEKLPGAKHEITFRRVPGEWIVVKPAQA